MRAPYSRSRILWISLEIEKIKNLYCRRKVNMSEEQQIVRRSHELTDQTRVNPSKEDIELMKSSKYEMDSEELRRWWTARNKSWKVNQICHWCEDAVMDTQCMGADGLDPCLIWKFTQLERRKQKKSNPKNQKEFLSISDFAL
jgi:hypothetical protein